jgi:hypothetical protein
VTVRPTGAGLAAILIAGVGAIGSRLAARLERGLRLVLADRDRVAPENVGVAVFDTAEIGHPKAAAMTRRRQAAGGVAHALEGDLRYSLRPGLVRELTAVVLCLDNPGAVRAAALALWADAAPGTAVLVLTCGGAEGGYQARLHEPPGLCPACLHGAAERRAAHTEGGASCADTTAPRASAAAAEAAAGAGAELLARRLGGDRSLAGCRLQRDDGAAPYVVRMPPAPAPLCPAAHGARRPPEAAVEALGGGIWQVTVGTLAERALARAGDDAEIVLGDRAVPLGGLYCPRCGALAPAAPLLVPAAVAAAPRPCGCGAPLGPLGERAAVGARELLDPALAPLSLRAWGAGPGDELVAVGRRGAVVLRCPFTWEELDDHA